MNAPTTELLELQNQVGELSRRLNDLARQAAELRVERDIALADLRSHLPRATPEEEADMKRAFDTGIPDGLATLIRELERGSRVGG